MFHDHDLTEEQGMIRNFVTQLGGEFGNDYFLKHARAGTVPTEFWQVLVDNGFLGLEAPEALGGSDFGLSDLVIFLHGLGRAGLSSYHLLGQLLCAHLLVHHADDTTRGEHLPQLIQGQRWGVALLEDTRGVAPEAVATKAAGNGSGVKLSGTKFYVPCAGDLDVLVVPAAGDDGTVGLYMIDPRGAGVGVTVRDVGVRVTLKREEQSITGDVFGTVELDGAPGTRLDAGAGAWPAAITRMLLMLAATAVGWGDRVIDQGVDYANQRVLYSEPISAYQAIQHPMVRAKTDVELAKLLIERAVTAAAEGADPDQLRTYNGLAKQGAVDAAFAAFDISMQAHGGSSFDRETGLITIWPLMLMARPYLLKADAILEDFGAQLLAAG